MRNHVNFFFHLRPGTPNPAAPTGPQILYPSSCGNTLPSCNKFVYLVGLDHSFDLLLHWAVSVRWTPATLPTWHVRSWQACT